MNKYYKILLSSLDTFASKNPYTWIYGLARSVLALSIIITLLFSSENILFDEFLFGKSALSTPLNNLNYFFVFGYENLKISRYIAILILSSVIFGYYPRYTGILQWWITFSFLHSGAIIEGGDQIASIITFFLIPITILDSRKNHWHSKKSNNLYINFIGRVCLILISFQMSIIYFHSVIEKIYKVSEWSDGTAVYYFFNDSLFGYPNWMELLLGNLLESKFVFFITWLVILLELLLFTAFFMDRKKKMLLFPLAVLFHFFIALIFGLVSFFFAVLGGLIIYLIPYNYNYEKK